jgi:hypothetical protein
VSHLVKAQKVAEAFGVHFLAILQPSVYFKEPLDPAEGHWGTFSDEAEHARDARRRILERAAEARRRDGLRFADLGDALDGVSGRMFTRDLHLTEEGNRRMAVAIADKLAGLGIMERARGAAGRSKDREVAR